MKEFRDDAEMYDAVRMAADPATPRWGGYVDGAYAGRIARGQVPHAAHVHIS